MAVHEVANAVTPIVLTYNEEPNLQRTLESLRWARRILIVDSGSNDRTEVIPRAYPPVDWCVRRFEDFAGQWRHALQHVCAECQYGLARDADMAVPSAFVEEMSSQF